MDLNLIAFPEFEGLDHNGRKTDGEAVAPLGDLHHTLLCICAMIWALPRRPTFWPADPGTSVSPGA
ncbi:hypothetical protein MES5069_400035 [Mesorhizobium escarrei]|uniref:Transposase n=1 Tax=Mesorhizobium escarrei TaxID=666018 RepID=A0ABN8K109_9HYPH|nr:hypothetical protein MES5069_400035 [Mesorhizobium escarrei]